MEDLIIVDGYNVLYAWPELEELISRSNLEHARIRMIEILNNYQGFKGAKIIIVFDAQYVENGVEKVEYLGDTEIIYSGKGQTADTVIERLVGQWTQSKKVYVATSDYDEQKIIFGKGAYRISAREFVKDIKKAVNDGERHYVESFKKDNDIGSRLSDPIKKIFEKWRRE